MRSQRHRCNDGDRDETRRPEALVLVEAKQEERQRQEREHPVGPRLGSVDEEQGRARRCAQENGARRGAGKTPGKREEEERRDKGEESDDGVEPGRLGPGRKRLLGQIEERGARVGLESPDEVPRRHPSRPEREHLIVPERPLEQEEQAARQSGHDEKDGCGRECFAIGEQ